jgi:hypothetical protein
MRLIGLAILITVSFVVASVAVTAQQAGKVYRIGILGNVQLSDSEASTRS